MAKQWYKSNFYSEYPLFVYTEPVNGKIIFSNGLSLNLNEVFLSSENEKDLFVKYKIITPDTNPETNLPWSGNERETWISNQLQKNNILQLDKDGKLSFIDSAMMATLITYASMHKTGKVIEIMTVINQVGKAITDNTALVNQDYERLLHSMLIEMYTNHRELYTALYAEEKIQEVYESKAVVDFLKIVFTNKYIATR